MKHIDILTLEQLIAERGLNVDIEEIEIVKNSVPCKGIRIIRPGKEEISPVVYYSASDTLENICKKIADAVALQGPEFNLELLKDPTYFADNAYIAVVRHNGESKEVISKTYFNLDMIMKLYIIGNPEDSEHGSVKVTERLLNELGILEEDAWDLATIFHESCHSTGHESRLNRIGLRKVSFGSETYSKEELIAEVGAACMLSTLGMASDETICNNAAYVHGWLQALKEDRRLIVSAAGQAEKACRFILEHSSFDWSSATVASPI